jgi:Ca2+-binding RTX toxin-like protein
MSLIIPHFNLIGTGDQLDLGTTDSLYLAAPRVIQSLSGTAVRGIGSNQSIRVDGEISGEARGISLGDTNDDTGNLIQIGSAGSVGSGTTAIQIQGSARVENAGLIYSGGFYGLRLDPATGGRITIVNDGTIISAGRAIERESTQNDGEFRLINRGVIEGGYSYLGSAGGIDVIRNSGKMVGIITFEGDDDIYNGRNGRLNGDLSLGSGDDFADWRGGTVTGTVSGSYGKDTIIGGGGNDKLYGGFDADRMTGGGGNDEFGFFGPNEPRDIITDFSNKAGNNDRFFIYLGYFDGFENLSPGALAANQFRARADNKAQDANDRFIFRTTDKTVWFDEDGKGGEGPRMLADLQAGATVTAADFLII